MIEEMERLTDMVSEIEAKIAMVVHLTDVVSEMEAMTPPHSSGVCVCV